jgi:hypothetical protein
MKMLNNLIGKTFLFLTSMPSVQKRINFATKLIQSLNDESTKFVQIRLINKTPKIKINSNLFEDLAIIIQGPVLEKDEYTLKTIKFLLDQYLGAKIILSTWPDQNTTQIDEILNPNLFVIKNELPVNRGPNNINLQLISTVEGIKKAKDMGALFLIKTRTDQRFYSESVYDYCKSLIQAFPLDTESSKNLKNRLVACSFTTLKYRPYGLGDMFMFGQTDDMLKYWDLPLSNASLIEPNEKTKVLGHAKLAFAEVYITLEFMKKINRPVQWTLEDTWHFYTEYFTLIDHEAIKLHWCKYDSWKADRFDYEQDHTFQIARFNDWFISHLTKEPPIHIPEHTILNSPFGGLIAQKK